VPQKDKDNHLAGGKRKAEEGPKIEKEAEDVKPKPNKRSRKRLLEVPRDAEGKVIYPVRLGAISLISLGQVVHDRESFHTDRYILPVGFKTTRIYSSYKDPSQKIEYTSEIRDGGLAPEYVYDILSFCSRKPLFDVVCNSVTAEDDPENPVVASTSTAAWQTVLQKVKKVATKFANISGPDYFGLSNPTIKKVGFFRIHDSIMLLTYLCN